MQLFQSIPFVALAMLTATPVSSQSPVREACRADIGKHCKSVDRDKKAIAQCLRANRTKLSRTCKRALITRKTNAS